jgi:hypothetical protein
MMARRASCPCVSGIFPKQNKARFRAWPPSLAPYMLVRFPQWQDTIRRAISLGSPLICRYLHATRGSLFIQVVNNFNTSFQRQTPGGGRLTLAS